MADVGSGIVGSMAARRNERRTIVTYYTVSFTPRHPLACHLRHQWTTAAGTFPGNECRNVGDEQLRNIGKEDVWEHPNLTGEIVHKYPSAPKRR